MTPTPEEKINQISEILSDINFHLRILQKNQEKILLYLIDEDKLKAERLWRKKHTKHEVKK